MRFKDARSVRPSGAAQIARRVFLHLESQEWGFGTSPQELAHRTGTIVYRSGSNDITWQDEDGEARTLTLPDNITPAAIAALLTGLATLAPVSRIYEPTGR